MASWKSQVRPLFSFVKGHGCQRNRLINNYDSFVLDSPFLLAVFLWLKCCLVSWPWKLVLIGLLPCDFDHSYTFEKQSADQKMRSWFQPLWKISQPQVGGSKDGLLSATGDEIILFWKSFCFIPKHFSHMIKNVSLFFFFFKFYSHKQIIYQDKNVQI